MHYQSKVVQLQLFTLYISRELYILLEFYILCMHYISIIQFFLNQNFLILYSNLINLWHVVILLSMFWINNKKCWIYANPPTIHKSWVYKYDKPKTNSLVLYQTWPIGFHVVFHVVLYGYPFVGICTIIMVKSSGCFPSSDTVCAKQVIHMLSVPHSCSALTMKIWEGNSLRRRSENRT